jgi:hypothetical protein
LIDGKNLNTTRTLGLFERWLSIERASGRSMTDILADLNAVAGTNYKHNWPSVVAGRGYELERCPVEVRRYMMRKVMADELTGLNIDLSKNKLEKLILSLT